MIERIIEFSIRNRFLVLILAAALAGFGVYAVLNTPVDAIPDLTENQVIVFTDWMGRSPQEIEDQVTYPLSLKLQGLAGVKAVRSSSEFNFSMITIIFDDDIDYYFARQRVLEKLVESRSTFLPPGVVALPGPRRHGPRPDLLVHRRGRARQTGGPGRAVGAQQVLHRPAAQRGPGVAEVATVGGTPLEYQIDLEPEACGPTASPWARSTRPSPGATRRSAAASSTRTTPSTWSAPSAGSRTRATSRTPSSRQSENGTPIYVKDVATVQLGPAVPPQRLEKDGNEVVGGVVLMRYGENPLAVTRRVKEKIQELQPGLPDGRAHRPGLRPHAG